MPWSQIYDPFASPMLSTLVAAAPLIMLLVGLALFRLSAPVAALLGLAAALGVAIVGFGMPFQIAVRAALFGAAFGLFPIGWLVLNVLFLYQLTKTRGLFQVLQDSIAGITDDRRLQLLLVAFCFGAFFEGCAGFGAPVAVTGAMLVGLGFSPFRASCMALIANTAPVAFGSLGTPIIALAGATDLPLRDLSAMVGRQLPLFSFIVPFWLVAAFAGLRGMWQVWPAILVAAVSFAVPQFLVSNFHGPWLVDIVASLCSMGALVAFLKIWRPKVSWIGTTKEDAFEPLAQGVVRETHAPARVRAAWMPWAILAIGVFTFGTPQVKAALDAIWSAKLAFPGLDQMVVRLPPVVAAPHPEAAAFNFNLLSATGTAILLSAIVAGVMMRAGIGEMIATYARTLRQCALPLITIAAMLSLGYVTRYSGVDSTLGLAFARTGALYPFFGTLLGWLGVTVTGSDTASNVLFGGLQKTTAEQLGLSATLMAAANSSGGVMGKMMDAQSIVVASTATGLFGREGEILRYVFFHSVALVVLVGALVAAQAHWAPLAFLVVGR